MDVRKLKISNILALIWGEKSDKLYIYVHGKMSCKEYAKSFAEIARQKGFQTLSFDLIGHGERMDDTRPCDIWNGMESLLAIADYAFQNWTEVSLFACSLGAYFSLNAYADKPFKKCLFQSPIVDMAYLINQMFLWFNVTQQQLQQKKEIFTPVDVLRWDYYQYVLAHPIIKWPFPTAVLYAKNDTLQSLSVIENFVQAHACTLTVSQSSNHDFMAPKDIPLVAQWLRDNI